MYTPKNPFPIISQNVDLTKHRDMINNNIEKITSDYNKIFKTIDDQRVKDVFWNLAEGKKEYDREYSSGVYNAAKGGLINFTRYLAAYYGEYNVRINTISPGGVFKKEENETFLKKYSKKVPLGRKANPNEINGSLIFLASDASSYVTGHNLIVDGGYTIW